MDQAAGFTIHVLDLSFIFYFVVGQNEAKNEILPKLMNYRRGRIMIDKNKLGIAAFDASDYLDNEETIAGYLSAALENPDPGQIIPDLKSGDILI